MKKCILCPLILLTILLLPACSHDIQSNETNDTRYDKLDDVQSIKDVTVKIPETIFTSSKRMKRLMKMK